MLYNILLNRIYSRITFYFANKNIMKKSPPEIKFDSPVDKLRRLNGQFATENQSLAARNKSLTLENNMLRRMQPQWQLIREWELHKKESDLIVKNCIIEILERDDTIKMQADIIVILKSTLAKLKEK